MILIDKIYNLLFGYSEKDYKSEQLSSKEESIKSDFFDKIYNNYKMSMQGNIMSMQNLITSINNNLQKFSERGYCGLSVKLQANNSETVPTTVFEVLKRYYKNQGFEVLTSHNSIKIYWVEIDNIPYSYYNSSVANIDIQYN